MDFANGLTFIFKEENWLKKILLTGLISVIPFVGFLYLFGWASEIFKAKRAGLYPLLPKTVSFSFLVKGMKIFLCGLIYYVPMILFFLFAQTLIWLTGIIFNGAFENILLWILNAGKDIVSVAYFLLFLYVIPVVLLIYLENEKIQDVLNFKRVYRNCLYNRSTQITLTVSLIAAIVVASLGSSLFIIGLIFTIPFAAAIYAYLLETAALLS